MTIPIIDTNVNLSHWPFRRLPHDEPKQLVIKLKKQGVIRAWAGSFDAILHRDMAGVNERLVKMCQNEKDRLLAPFGTVNPTLPDWESDLYRCLHNHNMFGLRLYPSYHNYLLDDKRFLKLIEKAAKPWNGLSMKVIQIVVTMEDRRTQHPLLQVPHVDTRPLLEIAKKFPKLNFQLLNAFRSVRGNQITRLASAKNIFFETAMLEGAGGIEKMLKKIPLPQLLFGSHFPFFVFESAQLKLKESDLEDHQRIAICNGNIQTFFPYSC